MISDDSGDKGFLDDSGNSESYSEMNVTKSRLEF